MSKRELKEHLDRKDGYLQLDKVLGFKKEDAKVWDVGINYNKIPHVMTKNYKVNYKKLIPVVSLAWLEKLCKRIKFTDWEGKCSCGKPFTISHPDELEYIQVSDLLTAARKEATQ